MARKTSRSAETSTTAPADNDLATAAAESGAAVETIAAAEETQAPAGETVTPSGETPGPAEETKEPDRIEVIAKRLDEIAAAITAIGDPDLAMDTARDRFQKAHDFMQAEEKRLRLETEALREAMYAQSRSRNEILERLRLLRKEAGELVEEDAQIKADRIAVQQRIEQMHTAAAAQRKAENTDAATL